MKNCTILEEVTQGSWSRLEQHRQANTREAAMEKDCQRQDGAPETMGVE